MGILEAPAIFVIAWKMRAPRAYLGLVPIVNVWMVVALSDNPPRYRFGQGLLIILLCLVPVIGVMVALILWGREWGRISERMGQPKILGWVAPVPLIGAVGPWLIAARGRPKGLYGEFISSRGDAAYISAAHEEKALADALWFDQCEVCGRAGRRATGETRAIHPGCAEGA